MSDTAVATTAASPPAPAAPKTPVHIGTKGLQLHDLDSLYRFANYVSKSGLAPKGMESPEAIFVAVQMGMELGISPMMALQNIGVINGRPGVFGDLPLALVRNSGLLEEYREEEIGKPSDDTWGFKCTVRRVGCTPKSETFTVADAKRAGLWGKAGPWTQWPKRMLKFRARGFLLRDEFGDVLKGVKTVDELEEMSAEQRFQRAKPVNGGGRSPAAPEPPTLPTPPSSPLVEENARMERLAGLAPENQQEDKAEADAGLAPSQQQTATATATENLGISLGDFLAGHGIDWETFQAYGRKQGWKAPWDNVDGFESLGVAAMEATEGFWTVRERIKNQILKAKAEGRV
jgi:hypothetical protein